MSMEDVMNALMQSAAAQQRPQASGGEADDDANGDQDRANDDDRDHPIRIHGLCLSIEELVKSNVGM